MKPDVKLVYDPTCPHVSAARQALLQAFAIAGRPARWTEWRTDSSETPERLRRLGSPTILVRDRDVAAAATAPTGPCCRLYGGRAPGAPSPDVIAKRLKTRSWKNIGGIASGAFGVATFLLPAGLCPACWPAYAAVLASLGAGFVLETTYQASIATGLFALAIASHSFQARRNGRCAALLLALAGASVALAGRFILGKPPVQYAGLFAFVLSAVWAAVDGRRQRATNNRYFFSNQHLEDCHECEKKG